MTAEVVYEREVNPHGDGSKVLDELGFGFVTEGEDWSALIGRADGQRADELTVAAARIHKDQEMDCVLLGHSLAEADHRSVHLVTNDEALLVNARRLLEHLRATDQRPAAAFMAIDSIDMMNRLLHCGAIDMEVMEGALLADWDKVSQRPMGANKRRKKHNRLLGVARQLNVSLPDPDHPYDDSGLIAEFLGKVNDHGP